MITILTQMFFAVLGLISGFSALLFALFTILAISLLINSWRDHEFNLRDRCWITLLLSLTITWGGWLTYMAGYYSVEWLT